MLSVILKNVVCVELKNVRWLFHDIDILRWSLDNYNECFEEYYFMKRRIIYAMVIVLRVYMYSERSKWDYTGFEQKNSPKICKIIVLRHKKIVLILKWSITWNVYICTYIRRPSISHATNNTCRLSNLRWHASLTFIQDHVPLDWHCMVKFWCPEVSLYPLRHT